MELCGRCGKELGRGLERGRFCAKCGHENPGNARYPLWDQGAETRVGVGAGAAVGGAVTATAVALPRIADSLDDATRVRMPSIPMMSSAVASAQSQPVSTWRTTLLAALVAMAVIVVLGFVLLFH
ncbi:hypothetical protein [Nocardioides nematodiphilus]|uniref:hypothetical protein n=1 Tax=Nocardioides nematodiphilus TaxID=2849669 RepID=UPI001CD9A08D|nr:hypothetical protein [Nocardioides nematodiphilus]MCA1982466.1 hypothetical protein [Nocardioides nematodiphilus]